MNPLSTITGILTYPARTVGAVAVAGARTTSRVVGWALEQALGSRAPASRSQWPSDPALVTVPNVPADTAPSEREPTEHTAITTTPAKKAPARKPPARKPPARKAPSKKAAVLAPALGLSEDQVAETEAPAASDVDRG